MLDIVTASEYIFYNFFQSELVLNTKSGKQIMGRRGGKLGSLTQSARSKEIKNARNIMFAVAVVLVINLIIEWVTAEDQLKQVAGLVNREQFNRIMFIVTAVYLGLIAMYATFGFLTKRYPVPITITAMVVFIAIQLLLAVVEPTNLLKGLIFKVLVIVGLAKAIQSAIAFENERKSSRRRRSSYDDDDDDDDISRRRRRREEEDDDDEMELRRRDEEDDSRGRSRRRFEEDDEDRRSTRRRRIEDDGNDRRPGRRRRASNDEGADRS